MLTAAAKCTVCIFNVNRKCELLYILTKKTAPTLTIQDKRSNEVCSEYELRTSLVFYVNDDKQIGTSITGTDVVEDVVLEDEVTIEELLVRVLILL